MTMHSYSDLIVCPKCKGQIKFINEKNYRCSKCGLLIPAIDGKLVFTPPPKNIIPFEKRSRGPEMGTPWRKANWAFLKKQISNLKDDAAILDVGAGRGDFLDLYKDKHHIALDIYPYPEVDVVCDLLNVVPFKESSFNMVLLMNVLEHVYNPLDLLSVIKYLLKPDGYIVIAIPFMLKIHQKPYDFGRYTHFALKKFAEELNLNVYKLEGFYDPAGLINETVRYFKFWVNPKKSLMKRAISSIFLTVINKTASLMKRFIISSYVKDSESENYPAPIGYHVVYVKSLDQEVH